MTMNANGSTLIELIVVLALVALLFGVALPALTAAPVPAPGIKGDSLRWAAVSSGMPHHSDSLLVLPDGRSLTRGGHDAR